MFAKFYVLSHHEKENITADSSVTDLHVAVLLFDFPKKLFLSQIPLQSWLVDNGMKQL